MKDKIRKLNNNGVKDSGHMWRTVNGVLYEHWTSSPDKTVKEWKKEYPEYNFITRGEEIFRSAKKNEY